MLHSGKMTFENANNVCP